MIPISKPRIGAAERRNILKAVDSGWISSAGTFIPQFEQLNAAQYSRKHGIAVSNGTVALHLALTALGIGPGDEVIVPDLTFAATINAVLYTGATPLISDVDLDSWTISLASCEKIVTSKTKAIIPVHLYGQPADMDAIITFAEEHGLYIIEDCAEAHGARYKEKPIGSFGHISCFSFYGNKIITTGEGGMCLCNDDELNQTMRMLRDHGMSPNRRYYHEMVGFNYRMTNMQAAIGVAQMEQFTTNIEQRDQIRLYYDENLSGISQLKLQQELPNRRRVNWLYSLLFDDQGGSETINSIQHGLHDAGIDSRPFFIPLSAMDIYTKYRSEGTPNAEEISRQGLSLPTFIGLAESQIKLISLTLGRIVRDGR